MNVGATSLPEHFGLDYFDSDDLDEAVIEELWSSELADEDVPDVRGASSSGSGRQLGTGALYGIDMAQPRDVTSASLPAPANSATAEAAVPIAHMRSPIVGHAAMASLAAPNLAAPAELSWGTRGRRRQRTRQLPNVDARLNTQSPAPRLPTLSAAAPGAASTLMSGGGSAGASRPGSAGRGAAALQGSGGVAKGKRSGGIGLTAAELASLDPKRVRRIMANREVSTACYMSCDHASARPAVGTLQIRVCMQRPLLHQGV